jgi:Ca2+-transporting ATPase
MILTDDDFSTIVKAVRIGRGLYDNLKKYIQFQMGVLIGFITMFLGASIFNVVGGVPLVPLQTLWVNFTTQIFMAVGLGYGQPAHDLMERKPRPVDEAILPRPLLLWLAFAGIVLGGTALGVIWWADNEYDDAVARTMGMTVFAIANVLFAFCVKDRLKSVFDTETFADGKLLLTAGLSGLAILLGTELQIFNRILGTVSLTGTQWVICLVAALTIVVVSEAQKAVLRRRESTSEGIEPETAPAAVGQTAS